MPDKKTAEPAETQRAATYQPIPAWYHEIETVELTKAELDALPEYSCTLPDSYKRPIAQGGRPWKRDLNFLGRFAPPGTKLWVYCEYIPDPDPKLLGILNKRVCDQSGTKLLQSAANQPRPCNS